MDQLMSPKNDYYTGVLAREYLAFIGDGQVATTDLRASVAFFSLETQKYMRPQTVEAVVERITEDRKNSNGALINV